MLWKNNKDEDNSQKTLTDKNHQASSQKFRQLILITWLTCGMRFEIVFLRDQKNKHQIHWLLYEIYTKIISGWSVAIKTYWFLAIPLKTGGKFIKKNYEC